VDLDPSREDGEAGFADQPIVGRLKRLSDVLGIRRRRGATAEAGAVLDREVRGFEFGRRAERTSCGERTANQKGNSRSVARRPPPSVDPHD